MVCKPPFIIAWSCDDIIIVELVFFFRVPTYMLQCYSIIYKIDHSRKKTFKLILTFTQRTERITKVPRIIFRTEQ